MTERHFFCKRQLQALFAVLVGLCLLCNGLLWASEQNASSAVAGHRVVSLKHISPEQGKAFLARLEFGTAGGRLTTNWLPGTTDTLLITGEPRAVQKAIAVLALVDAPGEFSIRQIGPASSLPAMPSNERIASAVGNICIGTFAQPPRAAGQAV